MNNMKQLILALSLILQIKGFSQEIKFENKSIVIEVCESKSTYLFVKGIESATMDIGNSSCISEAQEIKKGYWLIKLKAIKPFDKTTMLIITENDIDVPIIEIKYNKAAETGKYTLDLSDKPLNTTSTSTDVSISAMEQEVIKSNEAIKKTIDNISTEEKTKSSEKIEPKVNAAPVKVSLPIKENKNEIPNKYLIGETFIAGKVNSSYMLKVINLIKENNQLVILMEMKNKLSTELKIDAYQVTIKKNIKGRKITDDVLVNEISTKTLSENKEVKFYMKTPFFQINEHESVEIIIKEATEYGMGRDISIEIPYKAFIKINVVK
jgi:hypothetical protein